LRLLVLSFANNEREFIRITDFYGFIMPAYDLQFPLQRYVSAINRENQNAT